ncbi:MAG: diguanylate cyclase [Chloroflexota bacterium]
MPEVNFTPASVSYLNQFLLSSLITIYLAVRWFTQGRRRLQQQDILLLLFFVGVTAFSFLLFLEVSLLPAERLIVVYLENTALGLLLVALIQFAYHFPAPKERQTWERRVAFAFSGAYALGEAGYAFWRFNRLRAGQVEFRENWMDILVALEFLWVIFLFARSAIQNWNLPASRRFALTFILPFALAALNLVRSYYAVSTTLFHICMSIGILFTIFLFALNYLAFQPEKTSFIIKLSGAVLTTVMAVFGMVAWLVAPAYASRYSPAISDHRTLRFTPNARGGYDAAEVPFHFEQDFGQNLGLVDETGGVNRLYSDIDFTFPFFGVPYDRITVSNDGALGLGDDFSWKDYQYHFVGIPMMFPLLVDLNPQLSTEGGVFLRQESERAIVTYYKIPAYNHPDAVYTFQVFLFADGSFDFTYNGLPDMEFYVDDRPESSAWAIGVKPAQAPRGNADFTSLPMQIGPEGAIQDEYRSFRNYLHDFMLPIVIAVSVSGLVFLVGLPLLLNFTFARPLNVLLEGVQAFNRGQRGKPIPVALNDEIGYLTESFNRMGAELDGLIAGLESRVAARTSDLLAANERLRKLSIAVEQSPSAILITDTNGRIEYVNPAFTLSTGYSFEEVKGQNPRLLKSERTPPGVYETLWKTIKSGGIWRGELINRKKNGDIFWEYTVIAPILDGGGKTTHYVAVKEDITERVQAEQALRESEERYRQLFDLESDAIFIIRNSDGQILEANNAASQLYGFSREEILTKRNTDLSAEPEATQKATNSPAPSDMIVQIPMRWHRKKDGTRFPVGITARFVTWKGDSVHIAAIRDITVQHQIQQELIQLAATDPLTGLYNRRQFINLAQEVFSHHENPLREISLVWMDLDHFKSVNDRFGHDVGDAVLVKIANLLKENIRPNDFLARFGGEEFIILLPRTSSAEALRIAERLRCLIAEMSVQAEGGTVQVTSSLGVATTSATIQNFDLLLRHGDKALYLAKQAGRNCCAAWEDEQT